MTDKPTDNEQEIKTAHGTYTGPIQSLILSNTGGRPVRFKGVSIGGASTRTVNGQTQNRWDEYTLYVTVGGRFVLEHEYHTQWQGESSHTDVVVGDTIEDILRLGAETMWPGMDRQEYPEVVNDLLDDAGLSDAVAVDVDAGVGA